MDWDDAQPRPKRVVTVGEDLKATGIGELEERITALEAEIVRTRTEIAAKKALSVAAGSVFKS